MNLHMYPGEIGANDPQTITDIAGLQKCPELPALHFGSILLLPHVLDIFFLP